MSSVVTSGAPVRKSKLHRAQAEVFRDKTRFRVVVAGRRFGKTKLARVELIEAAAKHPNGLIWYVAPTYSMARSIMWKDLKNEIPRQWIKRVNETLLFVELINGAEIHLKGADRPDTLRGVGLNFVVCDEFQDMRDEVWEEIIRPTLMTDLGRALFIGTPKAFNHLHELYIKGQRQKMRKFPEYKSWQFPTIMSPFVPRHEIEAARRDMDPRTFRQEMEASFETMSGRVYYPFDRRKHVGRYPLNPKLPIWVGQDFNMDPMSSCIMQPQPNGELWVIDEIVLHNSNTMETCDELEKRYWRYMQQIQIYPDPAGGNRSHARGESALDIFLQRGFKRIYYRRQHPAVQDRINAVNSLLCAADGTIRLRIDEKCRVTIDALEQVIYKTGTAEVDKSLGKEHILDAAGYAIELEFPRRRMHLLGVSI